MNKIKVVMGVIGSGKGGLSRVAVELFKGLNPQKFDVTFLSNSKTPYFGKDILEHGGHIEYIASRGRHPLRHKQDLNRIMKAGHFDICHIHLPSASNIAPLIAAKKAGVPLVIAHSHCSDVEGNRLARLLHQMNVPKLAGYTDKRLACSRIAGEFMFGRADFSVLKNAIDLERFRYCPEMREKIRSGLKLENQFAVGHIGRMSSQKNPMFLLEIFAEILRQSPDSRLLYVGDGPMKEEIHEKARTLGIEDKICFTGLVTNPQDYMCAMDCLLLPSLFEGFPLTVVEAVDSGLPVFASDTITDEIAVFPKVSFFSLTQKPAEIAASVLKSRGIPRQDQMKELTDAGFCMEDVLENLEKIYLGR